MDAKEFDDLRVSHFNQEDQQKLISNCLMKSYLGHNNAQNVKKKTVQLDLARQKAKKEVTQQRNIMESASNVPQQPEDGYIFMDLFVKIGKKQQQTFFSVLCSGQQQISKLVCCVISDLYSNQLFIKQKPLLANADQNKNDLKSILGMKDMYYFNFDTVKAGIVEKQSRLKKAVSNESVLLNVGNSFSLQLEMPSSAQKSQFKQFRKFINQLKLKIEVSAGKKHQMVEISQISNFHQNHYKSQQQFFKYCQTGDILLFQSNRFASKVQRFITGSQYDHVAIIIKDPTYDILIYEAIAQGVCLTPWKVVIQYKWYQTISKITWRRLTGITRDMGLKLRCHDFVMMNIEKPYYISVNKLASNTSYIAASEEQQGFFCSQLVARIYKILEILPKTGEQGYMPACNYYPYHFTEKNDLKLTRGQLSPQYQLVFNEKAIQQNYGIKQTLKD